MGSSRKPQKLELRHNTVHNEKNYKGIENFSVLLDLCSLANTNSFRLAFKFFACEHEVSSSYSGVTDIVDRKKFLFYAEQMHFSHCRNHQAQSQKYIFLTYSFYGLETGTESAE